MFVLSTEDSDTTPKDQLSVVVPMRSPAVKTTEALPALPAERMHLTADSDNHKLLSEAVSPTRLWNDTSLASKFAEFNAKLAPPEGLPFATCDFTSQTES
eukprot:3549142-Rhodomonas_salina.2